MAEKDITLTEIVNQDTTKFGSKELDNGNPYSWAKAKPMEFTQDVEELTKNYTITPDQIRNYLSGREASTLENIGSGLVQVGSQIREAGAGLDITFDKYMSPNMTEEEAGKIMELAVRNLEVGQQSRSEMLQREGIGGFAFQASNVIGQAALSALAGVITGGSAAPIIAGGIQEFGRKAGEYSVKYAQETGDYSLQGQSAKDDLIALAYAGVSTVIEAGLGAERVLNGLIAKGALKQTAKAALGEAAEEFLQEYAEYAADSVAGYNERGDLDVFKDALTGAVFGALGGGVMGFGMYYANKGKLTELFTRQGFDPATAKSMATEALDNAKEQTINELITRDQLQKHYGEKYDALKAKIDNTITNVGGLSFLSDEQRANYIETNAADLARQIMVQAAIFKTDTDSILNLSDVESIGNRLVLNTPDMHDQVVLRQRIADKKEQLKALRETKTQKKAQKLGVEGETIQESQLNLQIKSLQDQIKRLDEQDLIETKTVARKNKGVDVVQQAMDAGKGFTTSASVPTQSEIEGWLAGTPRTYRQWFGLNKIPQSVRASLTANASRIKDIATVDPDVQEDLKNAVKRIANGLTMDNFAEMMANPTRDAHPFKSAAYAYLLLSNPDVTINSITSYSERLQAQQTYKNGVNQTSDDIMSQVIKENTPDKWNTDGTTDDKALLMLYEQKTLQSKSSTIAAIRGGDVNYISAILQEKGIKTRSLSGTQIKEIARMNWQWFIGQDVGMSAGRYAQRIALNAIEENVVSGDALLLRNGFTQEKIDKMDDKTWNKNVRDAYKKENPQPIEPDNIDWDAIPDDFMPQTDIADENARLDDIYPAYEGETITINGKDRSVYNSAGERIAKSAEALRNFYKWFGDSKVVDEQGRPLVVYHGTTRWFHTFDKQYTYRVSNLGAGFYFTNDKNDAISNYMGGGPDFDSRLSVLAQQLSEDRNIPLSEAEDIILEQNPQEDVLFNVYLKIENPFILGGENETFLTYKTDKNGKATGDLVEFAYRMDNILDDNGIERQISQELFEFAQEYGGLSASKIEDILSGSDLPEILSDYDFGTVGQLLSETVKQDFDGFIDNTVFNKFKNMGLTKNTTHYIAFEPNQIKSVDNRGTFDAGTGNIYYQSDLQIPDATESVQQLSELNPSAAARKEANEAWKSFSKHITENFDALHVIRNGQARAGFMREIDPNSKYKTAIMIVDSAIYADRLGLVEGFYAPEQDVLTLPVSTSIYNNTDKLKEYLTSNYVKTIFRHEFTHVQDVARGVPTQQVSDEDSKYYNNPAEFNAYSQQAMQNIADSLNNLGSSFYTDAALENWPIFLKYSMQVINDARDGTSKALLNFNERNKRRFLNRLYQAYTMYKGQTGDMYYQGKGKHLAGFDPTSKSIILSKSMNTGSLPHEMAHFWLQEMFNRSQGKTDLPESARASWAELSRILGITADQVELTQDQHEKFANLTEAYIFNKTALPAGTEPVIKDYMEFVPEKYNSFLDMGWIDGNGNVQNPILNEDSKRWFDAYYSGIGLSGDAPTMTKFAVSDEPAKKNIQTERQELLDTAHNQIMKTREDAENVIEENLPAETRQQIVDKIQDYDTAAQDFLAVSENSDDINDKKRSVWQKTMDLLHAGRGTDTREETMQKVNDWVKNHWDEALAIAKLNPNYYTNPTEIPTSLLIRAVAEQNTDMSIKDLLRANFAMAKSLEMKTGGLNNDTHDSMFLIGLGRIQNNLNQAYALKRFGASRNATARVEAEINKFCERYASDVMSGRKSWQDIMALAASEFGNTGHADSQVLSQTQLPSNASKQDFIKYMKHLIKVQAGAEMTGEQIAKFNEIATAAQIASTDLDSDTESVYRAAAATLRRYQDFVAESVIADNWFDKVAGQYFSRAMLSGLTTQTKNLVGNKFENWIVRAAIASKYGKSTVSTEVITKERNRLTDIYETSLLSIPQMENLSDPTLVHGEGYGLSENSVNLGGIRIQTLGKTAIPDPLAMLGRSDFYFRREVYLATLAARASKYAKENNLDADTVFKEFKKLSTTNMEASDARKEAIILGHTAVFTQNGSLAQALNKVRRVMNEMIPLGHRYGLGNLIAPFTKTPSNIVEMGAKALASPFTSVYELATTKQLSIQHRVDLGNLAGALLLFAATAALAGDYEPPYKVGQKYDPNKHYDSLRIGGVWIKLDSFGAMETPLRLLLASISTAKGAWPRVVAGTFAQIPVDLGKLEYAITKPEKGGASFLEGEIDKFIPTIASDAAKAFGHQSGIVLDSPYLIGNKTIRKLGLDGTEPSVNDWIRLIGGGIIQVDNR